MPLKKLKAKKVSIRVAYSKTGGVSVRVDPMVVKIKKAGEQVVWKCTGAAYKIVFSKMNPFNPMPAGTMPDGQECSSDEPVDKAKRKYKYSIVLKTGKKKLGGDVTIDPQVEVGGGGPPLHGPHH